MTITQIPVQRFSVTSTKSFDDVLARLEAGIGRPDMANFCRDVDMPNTFFV